MTDTTHEYQAGDAVLADFDGAQIPGVIEGSQEGRYLVRLSEPWTNATGQQSDEALLPGERLSPLTGDTVSGELPG